MKANIEKMWSVTIKRNVILLAAIIVSIISAAWGYAVWLDSNVETLENYSEDYHGATSSFCSEIQLSLRSVMFYLCPLESHVNDENLPDFIVNRKELVNAFYIMDENIRKIQALQSSFKDEKFEMAQSNVVRLYAVLKAKQKIFEEKTFELSEGLNNEFLGLITSLEQLKRLHRVERANLEKRILDLSKGHHIQLYVIIVTIVIALSLIIINTFRSIKHAVDEQDRRALNLRKLSQAIEQSPVSVVITDDKGMIEYINPQFTRSSGYTLSEVSGRNQSFLKSGAHSQDFYKKMWDLISTGNEWDGRFQNKTKQGKLYWEYEYISPVKDNSGKITNFIGVKLDETERVNLERDRKRLADEMLKAQKLESVGVLAGGIAHDFNNILTAILGNTNIAMIMSKDSSEVYNKLVNVEKAILKAKDLTQQLLTFSKGGKPVKKIVPVEGLLKDVSAFSLMGANVGCEFYISGDIWAVEVDEGQINQVINNMIINASQAMPGGGTIEIVANNVNEEDSAGIPSLKAGRCVMISVKDYGVGISQLNLSKIFDPYFTTKQGGSGLGLASSYSIINNHGGLITVESEIDNGSIFSIYLPASSECVAANMPEKEKSITGTGKILVMDDDEMIRDMLNSMLASIGYEVVCVKDGNDAIEQYNAALNDGKPFDVVLMDLTIPGGLGGKDAIKILLDTRPEAKAIVYSGYSNDPVMANFKEYGFKDVISKPFKIDEMNDSLQKVIKSS